MTNAEFAVIAALVARRAAIWAHEAIALRPPDEQAPNYMVKTFAEDIANAMRLMPRKDEAA